jgi:hypothetical protein
LSSNEDAARWHGGLSGVYDVTTNVRGEHHLAEADSIFLAAIYELSVERLAGPLSDPAQCNEGELSSDKINRAERSRIVLFEAAAMLFAL